MEEGLAGALIIFFFFFHLNSGLAIGVWVPCSLEELEQHLRERIAQAQMERDSRSDNGTAFFMSALYSEGMCTSLSSKC